DGRHPHHCCGVLDFAGIPYLSLFQAERYCFCVHCFLTYPVERRLCGLRLALLPARLRGDENFFCLVIPWIVHSCRGQQHRNGRLDPPDGRAHVPGTDLGSALRESVCLFILHHRRPATCGGPRPLAASERYSGDGELRVAVASCSSSAR